MASPSVYTTATSQACRRTTTPPHLRRPAVPGWRRARPRRAAPTPAALPQLAEQHGANRPRGPASATPTHNQEPRHRPDRADTPSATIRFLSVLTALGSDSGLSDGVTCISPG